MIQRTSYLEKLKRVKDKQIIKVLTGVRRCGKSTILQMFRQQLLDGGVKQSQIIFINFEDLANEKYLDYHELYQYLDNGIEENQRYYIFLDEIQAVTHFEKVLDSLFIRSNVDIYVTGSNAFMLSGELATLLSGRYIEVRVHPLSFKEYHSAFKRDATTDFQAYLNFGGFPFAVQLEDEKTFKDYVDGIVNTVLVKDVLQRKQRSDSVLVEQIARFLTDTASNLITVKKIANTLTSMGEKTTSDTVLSYLSAFLDAYLFYRCDRYDISGKKYLSVNSKYYPVDMSLRYALLGTKRVNIGSRLETVVFLELLRRDYEIYVGTIENTEVDFVAIKQGVKEYYQVSYTLIDDETYNREVSALKKIKDDYRKILLTADPGYANDEGVEQINVINWLLGENE
ncbi:ATP-binding protein [Tetragenococcus koreensis]|uniref:ATP-binding protein n=1 Tax=Tetragenococcus koreensis TaxID=290335 RepID=UPI001F27BC63|nr:ATP-binding protein [Tetragenococcus koreensis]MCF1586163.1 ATP-binding protein [Tetragenococcus koreensis]MCF1615754.1 ATP-binding protein [Tetragenococcus koreensis]MCF1618827.1 ATP-binding protein [Tetragenococcus koreensis]MCF1625529.1 ATP-binding protein [Tetragenococcus koreensis]MCF1630432.1 ATP-binding protein [Tetragenococcus koreensis]